MSFIHPNEMAIGLAAGFVKQDDEEFRKILQSAATAITIGSITWSEEGREGNTGSVAEFVNGSSNNSLGIPHPPISYYRAYLKSMVGKIKMAGKKAIVSVAGFSVEDFEKLLKFTTEIIGKDAVVEINLGCPNIVSAGAHKPIFAYDLNLIEETLKKVSVVSQKTTIFVKLSPYASKEEVDKMMKSVNGLTIDPMMMVDTVFMTNVIRLLEKNLREGDAVVLSNTYPNTTLLDENGQPSIQAKAPDGTKIGKGGLGGQAIHEIVKGNIKFFRSRLTERIPIIGVGGIGVADNIDNLMGLISAGANGGVEIATGYFQFGPKIFGEQFQKYIKAYEE